ncbi:Ig-like domain-containing protein [Aestuariimicrobium kwangyangense]|uniref:Ig-like domain-containing protein n=1 Tax=Aestuariimicrobium kwangyangense TaxID=396389 RepID=UPI0003B33A86|nr:Ig-like domain-containing protein [Aestuariimicrobium kwangyangense]
MAAHDRTLIDSRLLRRAARGFRRVWGALLVLVLALGISIAAWLLPGLKIRDLHLNEGSIFAVNTSQSLVGNLNLQSDDLTNAAPVGAANYQVMQDETTVIVRSTSPNQLSAYDPARNQIGSPVTLPPNSVVAYGARVLAVANPDNGRVWYGSVDEMLQTDFQQAKAQLEVGDQGTATVTATGHVIGLSVASSRLVRPDRTTVQLPWTLDPAADVQLSAVGEKAVVLDRTSQQIWVEGTDRPRAVDAGSTAQLPRPTADLSGFDGAEAVYATRAGLIALTRNGARSLSGLVNQAPIVPVVVGSCVHGVFGSQYVRRCMGDPRPTVRTIPELPSGADLSLLDNRGATVLNDSATGYIWLVDKDLKLIKDWTRVAPPDKRSDQDSDQLEQIVNLDRSKPNQPPIARNDLGLTARVGRSTVLPLLDNDSDPDGDILTILGPPKVSGASLELIQGGTGIQVTLPAGATQPVEFNYTISDGRGKTATARAQVKPIPADQSVSNQLPQHFRPTVKLRVNSGQSATKRVLLDWRDPDGDDMILLGAKVEGLDDEVTFTSDGTVTFQDAGKTTGLKKIELTVSDGNPAGRTTVSELLVEVIKDKIVPPIANGDQVATRVGNEITVDPLANDVGNNLTLREPTLEGSSKNATLTPNHQDNTFRFKASVEGTYYVQYKASNGPFDTGLVRIDVAGATSQNSRPVAARDVVLLPPGGSALVDPLLNDSDADGDVLVLQTVSSDPDLKIVMEQRRYLTVTAERTPDKPVTLTYRVSDGTFTADGTIVVIPTKLVGSQKPQAERDRVKARAGSIVTINPLDNDSSPIGLPLSVDKIVEGPRGRAWVDGDKIRVSVPPTSTGVGLTYQIKDSDGQTASSTIEISVVSTDAQNEAPQPVSVEARVLAGTSNRILIPLDGIDNNGDPVRLLGLDAGPRLGRVTAVGDHYLTYQAFPTSQGTDAFRYSVVDSYGAVGVGEVRVGVAPSVGANAQPVGTDDSITVRPGRPVHLLLLGNDYDPDGDNFGFAARNPIDLRIPTKVVNRNAITFTAPKQVGQVPGKYYLQDARGATGSGTITVDVRSDARNLQPVAVDDQVDVAEIIDKDYIEAAVLKNDYDPDGSANRLTVTVPPQEGVEATATPGRQTIRVKVADNAQQVRYTITDAEGAAATAIVNVPGRNDVVPRLKDPSTALQVVAGQRTTLDLNGLVKGTNGRRVRLTSVDRVYRTNGEVIPSVDTIDWTPAIEYAGPAAIVFEVMDDVPAGDKSAKRAVISIPVTVKPAPNLSETDRKKQQRLEQPPQLRGEPPVLEVGQGEPEERIDLAGFWVDPNGQDFHFENWRVASGSGISWRADESRSSIYAAAPVQTKPGTSMKLRGTVVDAAGSTVGAELTIRVIGSTRPRPTAANDVVDDANAGQERAVSVLANDKSNLLNNTSLKLVSTAVEAGQGTARVSGDQVLVRPADGFVGTMTVRYTIVDATDDPSRQSDGRIRLTVRAAPGEPGTPRGDSVGDGKVVLVWTDGAANGLPIDKRVVHGSAPGGAAVEQSCGANTCTVTGLTNGRDYTFTVTQYNQLGSATSRPSATLRPDVKPETMSPPQVQFDDRALKLNWATGVTRGSPIVEYRVTLLGTTQTMTTKGTSLTWPNLENGKDYQFTVAASNRRADAGPADPTGWSDESEASTPEHPTGAPPAPTAVVARDTGSATGGEVEVSWQAPDVPSPANRDAVQYLVYANGKLISGADPINGTSLLFREAQNGTGYTFTVRGKTRYQQPGPESAPSESVTPFGRPGRLVGANIVGHDRYVTVVLPNSLPENGRPIDRVFGELTDLGGRYDSVPFDLKVVNGQVQGSIRTPKNGPLYYLVISASAGGKDSVEPGGTNSVRTVGSPLSPAVISRGVVQGDQNLPTISVEVSVPYDFADSTGRYSNGNLVNDLTVRVTSVNGPGTQAGNEVRRWTKTYGNDPGTVTASIVNTDVSTTKTFQPPIHYVEKADSLDVSVVGWLGGGATCSVRDGYLGLEHISNDGTVTYQRAPTPPGQTAPPTAGPFSIRCSEDGFGTVVAQLNGP